MILNDRNQTRILQSAVTSFRKDILRPNTGVTDIPTIELTIGSCKLVVAYDTIEDRDTDLRKLDEIFLNI